MRLSRDCFLNPPNNSESDWHYRLVPRAHHPSGTWSRRTVRCGGIGGSEPSTSCTCNVYVRYVYVCALMYVFPQMDGPVQVVEGVFGSAQKLRPWLDTALRSTTLLYAR